jgi:hypothetical protein
MRLTRKTSLSLFTGAVVALCAVELWVVSSPAFPPNSTFFAAVITADLLVGIPLLFYGLVARPYRLSPTTIAPFFLLAVVIAGYILPPTGRMYVDMAATLIPLIEALILGVVVWKARCIYQHYRHSRNQSIYFIDALEASIRPTFGNHLFVKLLTIEFALIFLAFFGWFMRYKQVDSHARVFTYHRKSLYPMVFLVFLLLMIFETVGLHLLIQHWSPLVAWILTIVSIYGLFWMIGEFNALRLLPIVLSGDTLHLRSGLRWSGSLSLADIVDVQQFKRSDAKSPDYLSFARAGDPQLVLVLKQPARISGLFGSQRQASRIGLFLDDVGAFRSTLDQHRQATQSKAP